jgi:hypothetical protein
VWAEYTAYKQGLVFGEAAAWAAFQGLQAQGLLVAASSRAHHKRAVKRLPVLLTVSGEEIKKGLDRSGAGLVGLQSIGSANVQNV